MLAANVTYSAGFSLKICQNKRRIKWQRGNSWYTCIVYRVRSLGGRLKSYSLINLGFQLESCFEVAANYLIVLLDQTDPQEYGRVYSACIEEIPNFLQIIIYFTKNYFWEKESLLSALFRAYSLFVAKIPSGQISAFNSQSDSQIESFISSLICTFEQLLIKTASEKIDEWRALVGAALGATFAVSPEAVRVAHHNGIGERLVDELARIQIRIALHKQKVRFWIQNSHILKCKAPEACKQINCVQNFFSHFSNIQKFWPYKFEQRDTIKN